MKRPSVTTLLDLLAKPALIKWANKQGLLGIDINNVRKKALAGGTSIHEQIENYCKGTGDFEREIDRQSFETFMQGKKLRSMECDIETEWFVGRYDAEIMVDDEIYIVDYKTGFKGRVYLEHKLQLIAYTMAKPAQMAIVPVPQFHLIPVVIENRKPYEDILKALSNIWQIKQEIE
jgi:hypothetical protein